VLVDAQSRDGSPVGNLLRQPTVRCADGESRRLDSLLGCGFAVIGRSDADLRVGPQAASVLERLGGRKVSLQGLEATEGVIDPLFAAHPAAVLRPDRYVFGVVDESWSLDRLLVELGGKLALR
jgi:hypothetical protein